MTQKPSTLDLCQ